MDPFTIVSAIGGALGALSDRSFQQQTAASLNELRKEMIVIQEQLKLVLESIEDLKPYILHTGEDLFRKFISGEIDALRLGLQDRISLLADPRHPTPAQKSDFERFALDAAEKAYTIFPWGAVSWGPVGSAMVTAFASFRIAQSRSSVVQSVKENIVNWLTQSAVVEFQAAADAGKKAYDDNRSFVDLYPKRCFMGSEFYLDIHNDGQPSNWDYDLAHYFDISAGNYDAGFVYREEMLSVDKREYAHPESWNPRNWPLAPGFLPTRPTGRDPAPDLKKVLASLNRQIALAKAGAKLNSDATANITAIQKLIDSIRVW
ncbi:hypothetical protein [Pseudomonas sp. NFACC07-1]|uniref:hypothetical protein n=1 Tax=Pseudomonas sp. NFACC07-1 TaxID=1566239 RepID=UPI0008C6F2C0|nr:hypothetical protein [Pseudomonas sp. NFACC07-1]SEJ91435.1 hypothetical protein SAMN03159298_05049 [Pseudomonas sp. NFACC07-1]